MNFLNRFPKYFNFELSTSLILTLLFYLKSLHASTNENFLYSSDIINAWLPQLINTVIYSNELHFSGIDFATFGGASEYFLRSNLMIFNPIILFPAIVSLLKNLILAHVYDFLMFLYLFHSFLSLCFAQKLCSRFLGFDKYSALFIGAGYIFSLYMVKFTVLPPIFFIISLMPVAIYSSLILLENFTVKQVVISALPILMIYLSGYVPIAIGVVSFSFIFIVAYVFYISPTERGYLVIVRPMSAFLLASIICLPLYISMAEFFTSTTGYDITKSLAAAAYDLASIPSHIVRSISLGLSHTKPMLIYDEPLHFGVVLVTIFILFLVVSKGAKDFTKVEYRLLKISFMFCTILILISFGKYSAASTWFYYLGKPISKMHIYQRHLPVMHFFLMIISALFLKVVLKHHDIKSIKITFVFVSILLVIGTYYRISEGHLKLGIIMEEKFIMELLIVLVFIGSIILFDAKFVTITATVSMLLINTNFLDDNSVGINNSKGMLYTNANNIMHNEPVSALDNSRVVSYFNTSSKKAIVKYIDIVPEFFNTYIPKNYPWFVGDKIILSDYYGYEPHLSTNRNYFDLMRIHVVDGKWCFFPDWRWLEKTGAEFIIYNDASVKLDPLMEKYVDLSDPNKILKLDVNTIIAPLKFENEKRKDVVFDNGYIRAYSVDKTTTITYFETNNANKIKFHVYSLEPVKVEYLFWPNTKLKFYTNGNKANISNEGGLDTIELPAGENNVLIKYENIKLDIFIMFYFGYFAVLVYFLFFDKLIKKLKLARKKALISIV